MPNALAIIGTTVIALAGLTLLIGLGAAIISMIDFSDPEDNGIRVRNVAATSSDSTEITRTQEVTFNVPLQLDTAQAKYVIPIGQVNVETDPNQGFNNGGGLKISSGGYRYQPHYGLFNNFIYLDYAKDLQHKLFDKQVAITHWAFLKHESSNMILKGKQF